MGEFRWEQNIDLGPLRRMDTRTIGRIVDIYRD